MRVAHIINSLTKASGLSAFCANMTQHLAELGVDIDLYVWWVGDDSLLPDHERIKIYETKDAGFQPAIRPDIVHIHSLWVPMVHKGCVYARKNDIPYVLSPHGMLSAWALRHRWWKKLPGMILYQYRDLHRASLLHATAQSEVTNIRRLRLKQNVAVVPLGTDLPSLHSTKVSAESRQLAVHAASLAGGDDIRTVLFLSRVHPVKGLRNLFNAWAALKRDWVGEEQRHGQPNRPVRWRLVIAGPDVMGHKEELLQLAQLLRLNAYDLSEGFCLSVLSQIEKDADVVFTGPVYGEDKNSLHGMADLFVLPSFTENFGAVVSDSLAYGVPVITTKGTPWSELEGQKAVSTGQRAGGSRLASEDTRMDEIASAGRCGWWVDIGVEPLVRALREAINMTDEERREMGENGRRLIETKYTWPVVAGEMKKAYERMLSSKEKR
ncbi:MAG: glycosyltransferase [Desulfobulbaceae bacterium]